MSLMTSSKLLILLVWRRGRDSNPRYGCPYAAFRVRCIRPLCHLSELRRLERRGAVFSGDGGETQGRDAAACAQSSRPSLRSSEYGPPPRSAMAKEISPPSGGYSWPRRGQAKPVFQ